MTWVKICGIKSIKEATAVAKTGVAAVGFNLFPRSRRYVDLHQARKIALELEANSPELARVGVFVDLDGGVAALMEAGRKGRFTHLQLHGDEPEEVVEELCARGWSVIKAIRVNAEDDVDDVVDQIEAYLDASEGACRVLVDAHVDGRYGGTGKRIDIGLLRELLSEYPLIVAGGLTHRNVADILHLAPISDGQSPGIAGVDVASGVEGRNGRKDVTLVRRFLAACQT